MGGMQSALLILFGSRASGFSSPHSDFDVAVYAARPLSFEEKIASLENAAKLLSIPEEKIDLVDAYTASPLLQFEIMKHGRVISGAEDAFREFQWHAWKRYQGTAKLRRAREEMLSRPQ